MHRRARSWVHLGNGIKCFEVEVMLELTSRMSRGVAGQTNGRKALPAEGPCVYNRAVGLSSGFRGSLYVFAQVLALSVVSDFQGLKSHLPLSCVIQAKL